MKKETELILYLVCFVIIVIALCSSCSPDVHWSVSKNTTSGRHTYMHRGWPSESCNKLTPKTPIKHKYYRTLKNFKHHSR